MQTLWPATSTSHRPAPHMGCRSATPPRSQANSAHVRQSGPKAALTCRVKSFKPFDPPPSRSEHALS